MKQTHEQVGMNHTHACPSMSRVTLKASAVPKTMGVIKLLSISGGLWETITEIYIHLGLTEVAQRGNHKFETLALQNY